MLVFSNASMVTARAKTMSVLSGQKDMIIWGPALREKYTAHSYVCNRASLGCVQRHPFQCKES